MTRFLIADDHPLFREALVGALRPYFPDATFAEADDFSTTLKILNFQPSFSVILLDLNMPGVENLAGLMEIKDKFPKVPVVIISGTESIEVVAQAKAFGANGFIPKSTPTREIAMAIIAVMSGEVWIPEAYAGQLDEVGVEVSDIIDRFKQLTPKQMSVLSYLRAGLANKQIAYEMGVSEATVKAHISALFKKLDVNNRTQAILLLDKFQV